MKKATVIEASDIKKILAEHFGVSEDKIIKTQYSYIVIEGEEDEND